LANSVIPIIPEESRYTLVKPVTKDQVQMVKDIAEMMVIRPITPVSPNIMGILFEKCMLHVHIMVGLIGLWCLTPLYSPLFTAKFCVNC
jgi:hypothetical protein